MGADDDSSRSPACQRGVSACQIAFPTFERREGGLARRRRHLWLGRRARPSRLFRSGYRTGRPRKGAVRALVSWARAVWVSIFLLSDTSAGSSKRALPFLRFFRTLLPFPYW